MQIKKIIVAVVVGAAATLSVTSAAALSPSGVASVAMDRSCC